MGTDVWSYLLAFHSNKTKLIFLASGMDFATISRVTKMAIEEIKALLE